jgi:Holliday junction resolvasome RuvABC endonuclease subunit
MKVLGLDLGTHCGYALIEDGRPIESGTWELKVSKLESPGMRYIRFRNLLSTLLGNHKVDLVAYELVRRHMGVEAAHIYGGLQAQMFATCDESQVQYTGIGVTTIKKRAIGKGKASKEEMISSAKTEFGLTEIEDDNHADALWIAKLAFEQLENGTI